MDKVKALLMTRVIWAALVMSQLSFFTMVLLFQGTPQGPTPNPKLGEIVGIVSAAMLFTTLPAGIFLRMQIYKRHWVGDAVAPQGYLTGNIIVFASAEAACLLGLVAAMLIGQQTSWPMIPAGLAMAAQALNFPTGRPMEPTAPTIEPM